MKPFRAMQKYGRKIALKCKTAEKKIALVVVGGATVVASQVAGAVIDVTSVTATLTDGTAAVTTIGTAALGVFALIGIFVWLRRPVR